MADVARCLCPAARCPIHGDSPKDPLKPYAINENDKRMLRQMRIAPFDPDEIEQVRQADEDRFKP
jgi:hypothetical protein